MIMSTFVGGYVNNLVEVLMASALSRQHAIILGAPGYGKTAVSRSLARTMAGNDGYSFTRIDPSTPPDVIRGAYNPAALLDGRLERVTDGTPYDSRTRIALIDEIGRGNEVTFDALLDTLDRLDSPSAPPVWATSNFMPSNDRVAALIDRFALWYWIQPDGLDVAGVAAAQLNGSGGPQIDPAGLPTWDQVNDIHTAVPGSTAVKVIGELLSQLAQEGAEQGRRAHPRRVAQWSQILFRVGVWYSGTADFAAVPDAAARLLRYAWPAVTAEEQASWAEIAASVVDTVGAAIESAMVDVLTEMKRVAAAPVGQRTSMIPHLGSLMQNTQVTLEKLADKDDDRVKTAVQQMQTWLSLVIQGKTVE
jgi:MoxR-like ATPase